MLKAKRACELARELPDVTEYDHFGSSAFRAKGGTFATVWPEKNTVNLRLTLEEQRRFVTIDGEGFVEIDNAWGRQGWTTANLDFVDEATFRDALLVAWQRAREKAGRKRPVKKSAREPRKR